MAAGAALRRPGHADGARVGHIDVESVRGRDGDGKEEKRSEKKAVAGGNDESRVRVKRTS